MHKWTIVWKIYRKNLDISVISLNEKCVYTSQKPHFNVSWLFNQYHIRRSRACYKLKNRHNNNFVLKMRTICNGEKLLDIQIFWFLWKKSTFLGDLFGVLGPETCLSKKNILEIAIWSLLIDWMQNIWFLSMIYF